MRSSIFFYSDSRSAGDQAAHAMADHGLNENEINDLAEEIGCAIDDYFAGIRDTLDERRKEASDG